MQREQDAFRVNWPGAYAAIPKDIFYRDDVYQRELNRIFGGPEWHPVAHRGEVPERGDFKSARIGEARVLVVHGDDGEIRVFVNSCPHRGTELVTCARGNAGEIECPYHRWLFDNRGNLMNAPGSDHFPESFRKEDFGLRSLRSAEFLGLIFSTFDAAAPTLDSYLGDVRPYLETALHKDGRLNLLGYQKVVFASNWKEYNDQEGYHAPLLHRAFRLLGWQGGKGMRCVTEYGHMAVDAELQRMANIGFLHDTSVVEVSGSNVKPRSVVITLFPLTQVLKHLDVHTIRFAHPLSPHETEVHYTYFCHADDDEEVVRHRLRQSSNLLGPSGLISLEDGAVFNRLHKGLMTPGTIAFHRGVNGRLTPPCAIGQNDEAGNLVKWERYRDLMDFERD